MNIYKYDYLLNMMLNSDHWVDTMLYLKHQQHDLMINLNEDAMFQENLQMMMMIELILLNI
jgi:hypothetical protein